MKNPPPPAPISLPPTAPASARGLVVLVDDRVGHVGGELALVHPVLVQQLAVGVDVAGDEDAAGLVAERLDAVHALDRAVLVALDARALLGQHRRGLALDAGIEDEQVRLELVEHLGPDRNALDLDRCRRG